MTAFELIKVTSDDDRKTYHAIRKRMLFDARGRGELYAVDHPDDTNPRNVPLLLKCDGVGIAVARLDLESACVATIRLVAVDQEQRNKGCGRILAQMLEARAIECGVTTLRVHAAADAVGYYEKVGFTLLDSTRKSPLMTKSIARPALA